MSLYTAASDRDYDAEQDTWTPRLTFDCRRCGARYHRESELQEPLCDRCAQAKEKKS